MAAKHNIGLAQALALMFERLPAPQADATTLIEIPAGTETIPAHERISVQCLLHPVW